MIDAKYLPMAGFSFAVYAILVAMEVI